MKVKFLLMKLNLACVILILYFLFIDNSDVWSFGVLIYEIFELGLKLPYPTIRRDEFFYFMTHEICRGSKRLEKPAYGSEEMLIFFKRVFF